MDYPLAKELKEAGFPQQEFSLSQPFFGEWPHDTAPYQWPYNPTLEELIEACTGRLTCFSLEEHSNDWRAGYLKPRAEYYSGKTPTEAVARLWLAVHKPSA